MIVQCRCAKALVADPFGTGQFEKFVEGRAYALPSTFIEGHKEHFEPVFSRETKPLRQGIEVKGNDSTSKRARNTRRAKAQS